MSPTKYFNKRKLELFSQKIQLIYKNTAKNSILFAN